MSHTNPYHPAHPSFGRNPAVKRLQERVAQLRLEAQQTDGAVAADLADELRGVEDVSHQVMIAQTVIARARSRKKSADRIRARKAAGYRLFQCEVPADRIDALRQAVERWAQQEQVSLRAPAVGGAPRVTG